MTDFLRQSWAGLRALLVLTAVLGIGYPVLVWGVGRVVFPQQSAGSLITRDQTVVASRLLGQQAAGRQWFHPRPSVNDDDGLSSGGSNLGPSNPKLLRAIAERRAAVAAEDGVPAADVPADAVTASGSGLDPFISPAYARIQIARVAQARGLSQAEVTQLVAAHTQGRTLGFLGEPRVDVVELNFALTGH